MKNNKPLTLDYAKKQLLDAYNDEYWQKKYGVSSEELKTVNDISIQDKIISVNKNNKSLAAEA